MLRDLQQWIALAAVSTAVMAGVACGGDDNGNGTGGSAGAGTGGSAGAGTGGAAGATGGTGGTAGSRVDSGADTSVGGSAGSTPDASADAQSNRTGDADARADGADASRDGDSAADSADARLILTDAQIITVLHVSNVGEIEEAQAALTKAVNTQVRAFANSMIAEHTAADNGLAGVFQGSRATDGGVGDAAADARLDAALSDDGGIPLVESPLSQSLLISTAAQLQALQANSPPVLDVVYMNGQVAAHVSLLQSIDNVLLPSAQNALVRAQVTATRATVAAHVMESTRILNSLLEAGTPGDATAPGSDAATD